MVQSRVLQLLFNFDFTVKETVLHIEKGATKLGRK